MQLQTIELSFQYQRNEHIKAQRQYLFASKTITKPSLVIFPAYFLFAIFYLYYSSVSVLSVVALIIAVTVMVIGCMIYFYMPVYVYQKTAKYHEAYQLTFTSEGIHFKRLR